MARKILLADDSVTAQNMGRKILTDAGYEVTTVNNGSAALKKITETRPDLIVLDVYMPGYSGLEVCQRTKENRDTGHIPVLLTVGKLEPFKQDEARRVRADAFIIKPFEATELLAALGKLEDKVAPRERSKESHLPIPTMASFERLVEESGPQYGDQESGWKARLKIPGVPLASQPKPEMETRGADPAGNSSGTDTEETAISAPDSPPAPGVAVPVPVPFERPLPAGIPLDITPEEIAAISAAAARVNMGLSVSQEIERTSSRAQADDIADNSSQDSETNAPSADEGATQAVVPSEAAPESRFEAAPAEVVSPEPDSIQEPEGRPIFDLALGARGADETSLSNGNGISSQIVVSTPNGAEPVAVAGAAPEAVTAGSRWIAENVPVEAHEAGLVLEREMHKAHAAFAAAEHAAAYQDESAPVDRNDEPAFATMAPPAIGTPVPAAAMSAEIEPPAEEPSENQSALAAAASVGFHDIQRPAEAAKPPASPFAPIAHAMDESKHAVAAFGGPHPFAPEEPETDDSSAVSPETVSQVEMAAVGPDAWPSWKDIREVESKSHAETAPEATADHEPGEASLSSIVDSMLAELKPKLMAELAKKLETKKE